MCRQRHYTKRNRVRENTTVYALLILLVTSLLFHGCEKKEKSENPFEKMTQTEQNDSITRETLEQGKDRLEENTTTIYPATGKNFILTDLTEQRHYISVNGTQLLFKDISQPVVILYFFTPWSLPCRSEVPYLSELQKKYSKDIFVMGILINPEKYVEQIGTFVQEQHANFYIAASQQNNRFTREILSPLNLSENVPIPLTVIFHGGHYWRHYEGAIPIEMLEHDIKTLLQ